MNYQANLDAAGKWLLSHAVAPSGGIIYGSHQINPYFANLAAIGLTRNPTITNLAAAGRWMKWYVDHWNYDPPDKWKMQGTIYDFDYDPVTKAEHRRDNADSTDSYAATFLSLVWALYSTGNQNIQSYIKSQAFAYDLELVGGVILQTLDHHLTWAKPDYRVKYLMDNCEVYRGLRDLCLLWTSLNQHAKADYYTAVADPMLSAINQMWLPDGHWETNKGAGEPDLRKWYPDAVSQLFPVLCGVVNIHDPRAQQAYDRFNAAWPGWPELSFITTGSFPWVPVACVAALMGDTTRVNQYLTAIDHRFVQKGFPWPWYAAENGWYMRLNSYMLGRSTGI